MVKLPIFFLDSDNSCTLDIYNHLISNKHEWNNHEEMLPYLVDFALQEQTEDNYFLMVATSQAWYNGSYTMAARPIKSLEFHYTMIQFFNNNNYYY